MSRQKTGGRTRGTPNKVTATLKEFITDIIDKNRKQMQKDLQELEPKERLQILERLMQYVIPKQQAQSLNVDFEQLTDEQLNQVCEELTKGVQHG